MALEFTRSRTGNRSDRDRHLAAEQRAADALGQLLPNAGAPTTAGEVDDEVLDIRGVEAGGEAGWVGIAEAASLAGVSTGTVRQWYRAGLLATQRRDGERGGFLVRASDAIELASSDDDTVFDIDDEYWASEAEDARAEVRRLTAEIAELQHQIEAARGPLREARADAVAAREAAAAAEREATVLRAQLTESLDRNAELTAKADELRAQLRDARRAATFGSVTSTEWAGELDAAYRGPQRPQEPLGDAAVSEMGPSSEHPQLSDGASPTDDEDFLAMLARGSSPLVYGDAADDLLPEVEEKRGRRRTRR